MNIFRFCVRLVRFWVRWLGLRVKPVSGSCLRRKKFCVKCYDFRSYETVCALLVWTLWKFCLQNLLSTCLLLSRAFWVFRVECDCFGFGKLSWVCCFGFRARLCFNAAFLSKRSSGWLHSGCSRFCAAQFGFCKTAVESSLAVRFEFQFLYRVCGNSAQADCHTQPPTQKLRKWPALNSVHVCVCRTVFKIIFHLVLGCA